MNDLTPVGFFRCSDCENEWYDFDVVEGEIQDCLRPNCGYLVQAFYIADMCFGTFKCLDCDNKWYSAYTFVGRYQRCRSCEAAINPHLMAPLDGGGRKGAPQHDSTRCGRCIELGFRCGPARSWINPFLD